MAEFSEEKAHFECNTKFFGCKTRILVDEQNTSPLQRERERERERGAEVRPPWTRACSPRFRRARASRKARGGHPQREGSRLPSQLRKDRKERGVEETHSKTWSSLWSHLSEKSQFNVRNAIVVIVDDDDGELVPMQPATSQVPFF